MLRFQVNACGGAGAVWFAGCARVPDLHTVSTAADMLWARRRCRLLLLLLPLHLPAVISQFQTGHDGIFLACQVLLCKNPRYAVLWCVSAWITTLQGSSRSFDGMKSSNIV
jgi:hypothetical protein